MKASRQRRKESRGRNPGLGSSNFKQCGLQILGSGYILHFLCNLLKIGTKGKVKGHSHEYFSHLQKLGSLLCRRSKFWYCREMDENQWEQIYSKHIQLNNSWEELFDSRSDSLKSRWASFSLGGHLVLPHTCQLPPYPCACASLLCGNSLPWTVRSGNEKRKA